MLLDLRTVYFIISKKNRVLKLSTQLTVDTSDDMDHGDPPPNHKYAISQHNDVAKMAYIYLFYFYPHPCSIISYIRLDFREDLKTNLQYEIET